MVDEADEGRRRHRPGEQETLHRVATRLPKVLARPGYAMISRSLAERPGGIDRVEGEVLVPVDDPGSRWIVGGVFEDVPENSHLRYDILVSLEGMAEWSRNNWVGNDRYLGYVRLAPGVTPEGLDPAIRRIIDKHIDSEEMRKAGASLLFSMKPLREMHAGTSDVRNMFVMLTILASALLFTAMMPSRHVPNGVRLPA